MENINKITGNGAGTVGSGDNCTREAVSNALCFARVARLDAQKTQILLDCFEQHYRQMTPQEVVDFVHVTPWTATETYFLHTYYYQGGHDQSDIDGTIALARAAILCTERHGILWHSAVNCAKTADDFADLARAAYLTDVKTEILEMGVTRTATCNSSCAWSV